MGNLREDALKYHSFETAGKIEVVPTKPCVTQRDLSLAYTPGVAVPCLEIEKNPLDAFKYTSKGNLVAVVSNGTAVLGLGDIGALAGKPVMEGKGVLFKRFGDVDVFDIEVETKDPDKIIEVCKLLEPTFGGINLEDIKAPECFYIEETLKEELGIPVFHDDQHGTAIISGAGLINAAELVGKKMSEMRMVVSGAGAAGIACANIFVGLGIKRENILMIDSKGVIYKGRKEGMNPYKERYATEGPQRTLADAMKGCDVFMGVSQKDLLTEEMLKSMAPDPIIMAMANPDPEVQPELALKVRPDAIMATGRSDYPNQVNNVLGFPFIFRGALDVKATTINEEMKVAACHALAKLAKEDVPDSVVQAYGGKPIRYGREYIIPKPLDPRVLIWEASAVAQAAMDTGVAQNPVDIEAYKQELENRLGRSYEVIRVVTNKAKADPKRLVYPEGSHEKVLRAAQIVVDEGIAKPVLLGDEEEIKSKIQELHLDLDDVEIVDPCTSEKYESYWKTYFEICQRRGVSQTAAQRRMNRTNYFGTLMVHAGDADAFLGVSHDWAEEMRPAFQMIKPKKPGGQASALHIMIMKKNVYFLADTNAIVNPTADELADIAIQSAKVAKLFNFEPKVAMLSFSNFGSVDHPEACKVQEAVKLALQRKPDLMIDGEMQADAAVIPEIIEENFPFSRLKGMANVLIFPDLQSGNIAMNLLKRLGGAESIGPIQIGLTKPIHVARSTATVEELVRLSAFAVVDAQKWLV